MKKGLILVICAAIALAYAGMVLAQTNPLAQQTLSKPPMVNKRKTMGILKSIDFAANTIVVKHENSSRMFMIDPAAKILMGGKECRLESLKLGSKVTIFYKRGAKKRIAVEIIAQPISPAAKTSNRPADKPDKE